MTLRSEDSAKTICWKTIGVFGTRSCERLREHIHCRNCPTYRMAGRELLDRPMAEDYRARLTERLAAKPADHSSDTLRLMIFRVAGIWLALPSSCLEETLMPTAIVPIPGRSNRHFLGLVNTHGELQLCFTLEHILGTEEDEPPVEPTAASLRVFPRMLSVRVHGQRWLFPADEVLGILEYPRGELEKLPANLARSSRRVVAALLTWEERRIKLIDEGRLATLFQGALA
jgi:chemotaxis-related protein WspD